MASLQTTPREARLEYDRDVDALYIYLRDLSYAFGEDLDTQRRIDYAADHLPIGVELLGVSQGVDVESVPDKDTIIRPLREPHIPLSAIENREGIILP